MKEETFWEFRKKLKGKKEERKTGIKDKEGKLTQNRRKLKKSTGNFTKIYSKKKLAIHQKRCGS